MKKGIKYLVLAGVLSVFMASCDREEIIDNAASYSGYTYIGTYSSESSCASACAAQGYSYYLYDYDYNKCYCQ